MKNKRNVIMALVAGCIIVPIIISQILRIPLGGWTIGDENSWVGFFGGYVGGIIGGLVAFFVARYQIDRNFEKQIANEEMNRFINQMPSIVKIKYELTKVHKCVKDLIEAIDIGKKIFKDKEDWLDDPFSMYQLNESNWNSLDSIDDVDICTGLVELKHKYIDLYTIMTFDIFGAGASLRRLEEEGSGVSFEKIKEASISAGKIHRIREERKIIINGDMLTKFSEDIENAIEILEILLQVIGEEKEERRKLIQ
ncbi:hypothetical protein PAALTS15_09935 [Paenibacillus alvei TS-15]|uniref:Uncharacterized protein n=1 Tax=Paenibacillus alvei TS-15 TaxID=1117108 RepID=S9TYZ1_PAEAL|nr:hypothetical protein [Paenibacillus alvei]EPY07436.1 hypothetical protein PAALTS15_09935 [Paenibacillus alvei TS-15]